METLKFAAAAFMFILLLQQSAAVHDLFQEYRFSAALTDGYMLHWNFDLEKKTIAFAVNVSTTGWVGFGLSPNGQMPQSDVVIGWVDSNGNTFFHDRYANDRILPAIDSKQDWFLVSGEEENGHTILEFTRNLTTCDEFDLNIKADTSRVIWSYHPTDPDSLETLGDLKHMFRGSSSVNLLGGSKDDRVVQDEDSFTLRNENLVIPTNDTTYWCSVHRLPTEIRQQEKYIHKFGPKLSPSSEEYVHHIVVVVCDTLNHTHVGASMDCETATPEIAACRGGGVAIAAWAVGGIDFVYPNEVAYPIGGVGNPQYLILEMHYDNPKELSGIVDSSGITFSYTSQPPKHRAAMLSIGYLPYSGMIIPPKRNNFIINGQCPGECTKKFFPSEGITVFANLLHTHLVGHSVILRHFRQNEECDILEELPPIDENRRYDFNYQQINHLPREVKVLPGDIMNIECHYRTNSINGVTLGGESTREEMCFTFMAYYPQVNLSGCINYAPIDSYTTFARENLDPSLRGPFLQEIDLRLFRNDQDNVASILNHVNWTDETSTQLEQLLSFSDLNNICYDSLNPAQSLFTSTPFPTVDCSYEAPDECLNTQPPTCCEQVELQSGTTSLINGYLLVLGFCNIAMMLLI